MARKSITDILLKDGLEYNDSMMVEEKLKKIMAMPNVLHRVPGAFLFDEVPPAPKLRRSVVARAVQGVCSSTPVSKHRFTTFANDLSSVSTIEGGSDTDAIIVPPPERTSDHTKAVPGPAPNEATAVAEDHSIHLIQSSATSNDECSEEDQNHNKEATICSKSSKSRLSASKGSSAVPEVTHQSDKENKKPSRLPIPARSSVSRRTMSTDSNNTKSRPKITNVHVVSVNGNRNCEQQAAGAENLMEELQEDDEMMANDVPCEIQNSSRKQLQKSESGMADKAQLTEIEERRAKTSLTSSRNHQNGRAKDSLQELQSFIGFSKSAVNKLLDHVITANNAVTTVNTNRSRGRNRTKSTDRSRADKHVETVEKSFEGVDKREQDRISDMLSESGEEDFDKHEPEKTTERGGIVNRNVTDGSGEEGTERSRAEETDDSYMHDERNRIEYSKAPLNYDRGRRRKLERSSSSKRSASKHIETNRDYRRRERNAMVQRKTYKKGCKREESESESELDISQSDPDIRNFRRNKSRENCSRYNTRIRSSSRRRHFKDYMIEPESEFRRNTRYESIRAGSKSANSSKSSETRKCKSRYFGIPKFLSNNNCRANRRNYDSDYDSKYNRRRRERSCERERSMTESESETDSEEYIREERARTGVRGRLRKRYDRSNKQSSESDISERVERTNKKGGRYSESETNYNKRKGRKTHKLSNEDNIKRNGHIRRKLREYMHEDLSESDSAGEEQLRHHQAEETVYNRHSLSRISERSEPSSKYKGNGNYCNKNATQIRNKQTLVRKDTSTAGHSTSQLQSDRLEKSEHCNRHVTIRESRGEDVAQTTRHSDRIEEKEDYSRQNGTLVKSGKTLSSCLPISEVRDGEASKEDDVSKLCISNQDQNSSCSYNPDAKPVEDETDGSFAFVSRRWSAVRKGRSLPIPTPGKEERRSKAAVLDRLVEGLSRANERSIGNRSTVMTSIRRLSRAMFNRSSKKSAEDTSKSDQLQKGLEVENDQIHPSPTESNVSHMLDGYGENLNRASQGFRPVGLFETLSIGNSHQYDFEWDDLAEDGDVCYDRSTRRPWRFTGDLPVMTEQGMPFTRTEAEIQRDQERRSSNRTTNQHLDKPVCLRNGKRIYMKVSKVYPPQKKNHAPDNLSHVNADEEPDVLESHSSVVNAELQRDCSVQTETKCRSRVSDGVQTESNCCGVSEGVQTDEYSGTSYRQKANGCTVAGVQNGELVGKDKSVEHSLRERDIRATSPGCAELEHEDDGNVALQSNKTETPEKRRCLSERSVTSQQDKGGQCKAAETPGRPSCSSSQPVVAEQEIGTQTEAAETPEKRRRSSSRPVVSEKETDAQSKKTETPEKRRCSSARSVTAERRNKDDQSEAAKTPGRRRCSLARHVASEKEIVAQRKKTEMPGRRSCSSSCPVVSEKEIVGQSKLTKTTEKRGCSSARSVTSEQQNKDDQSEAAETPGRRRCSSARHVVAEQEIVTQSNKTETPGKRRCSSARPVTSERQKKSTAERRATQSTTKPQQGEVGMPILRISIPAEDQFDSAAHHSSTDTERNATISGEGNINVQTNAAGTFERQSCSEKGTNHQTIPSIAVQRPSGTVSRRLEFSSDNDNVVPQTGENAVSEENDVFKRPNSVAKRGRSKKSRPLQDQAASDVQRDDRRKGDKKTKKQQLDQCSASSEGVRRSGRKTQRPREYCISHIHLLDNIKDLRALSDMSSSYVTLIDESAWDSTISKRTSMNSFIRNSMTRQTTWTKEIGSSCTKRANKQEGRSYGKRSRRSNKDSLRSGIRALSGSPQENSRQHSGIPAVISEEPEDAEADFDEDAVHTRKQLDSIISGNRGGPCTSKDSGMGTFLQTEQLATTTATSATCSSMHAERDLPFPEIISESGITMEIFDVTKRLKEQSEERSVLVINIEPGRIKRTCSAADDMVLKVVSGKALVRLGDDSKFGYRGDRFKVTKGMPYMILNADCKRPLSVLCLYK